MKVKFSLLAVTCIFFGLLVVHPFSSSAAGDRPVEKEKKEEKKPAAKKIRSYTSRKNNAVKIYPDPIKRMMHVVARENEVQIDFFVFDLEGTLIQHYKMDNGDHQRISGIDRGKYIYHVFAGDEETATGEFEIR